MLTPYRRHLILLFVVGFTWGYVVKSIVGTYRYIGWDDPQIITPYKKINLNTLSPTPQKPIAHPPAQNQ